MEIIVYKVLRMEGIEVKSVYPVFFTKTDTVVLVEVPDLEILTEGEDMVNAVEMARDAIELKCVSMEDDGMEIPLPSEIGSLNINSGTFSEEGTTVISLVDIDSSEYIVNDINTFYLLFGCSSVK